MIIQQQQCKGYISPAASGMLELIYINTRIYNKKQPNTTDKW